MQNPALISSHNSRSKISKNKVNPANFHTVAQIPLKAEFGPTSPLIVDSLFYNSSLTFKEITMPVLTQTISGRSIFFVEKKKEKEIVKQK